MVWRCACLSTVLSWVGTLGARMELGMVWDREVSCERCYGGCEMLANSQCPRTKETRRVILLPRDVLYTAQRHSDRKT